MNSSQGQASTRPSDDFPSPENSGSRSPAVNKSEINEIWSAATRLHVAGQLDEAETLYRRILELDPLHAASFHLLGLIARQRGNDDLAIELIGKSITIDNRVPARHNDLGTSLWTRGRLTEALASYQRALALKPDYADVCNNLGLVLRQIGKYEDANACFRRALTIEPANAVFHFNLGFMLQEQGLLDEAATCFRRTLALKPNHAEAAARLAAILQRQPRAEGADRPIRCVFLVHMVESWDAFAPIYDAMRQSSDFKPIVFTSPRSMPPDWRLDCEEENHRELEKLGIPHLRFDMSPNDALELLKAVAPDIVFRQQPWDRLVPPVFASPQLAFTRICYVPYGFLSIGRYTPDENESKAGGSLSTDTYFHRVCWRIFSETDMHWKINAESGARRGENVVVTGYTKFDQLLHRAGSRPPFWPISAPDGKRRFRLIWAPHHSLGAEWLGFGTFHLICHDMLDWARRNPGIEFVLKPHPHLWSKVTAVYKTMAPSELDAYLAEWKSLPNAALVENSDYGPLFAASDAMLTDGVSFLAEYPIFGKPLIFVDSGHHTEFNEAGSVLMEGVNTVRTIADARALCDRFRSGEPDPMAQAQKSVVARIMPYPGQSAQKVLEAIRAGLKQEKSL